MRIELNIIEQVDTLVRHRIIQAMIDEGQVDLETGLEMKRISASERIIKKENNARAGGGESPTDSLITLYWKLPINPR